MVKCKISNKIVQQTELTKFAIKRNRAKNSKQYMQKVHKIKFGIDTKKLVWTSEQSILISRQDRWRLESWNYKLAYFIG